MKFCPHCGSPVESETRFCGNCGENITPADGGRPVWPIVGGIAAVAALGVVGILVLGGGDGGGDTPAAASSTSTAPPATSPSTTAATTAATGPVVPAGISWQSLDSGCRGAPAPVVARNWQVSAPRQGAAPGENVDISLRNKDGANDQALTFAGPIYATVIDPSGSDRWTTRTVLNSVQTAAVAFPHDFPGGPGIYGPGAYTIVWSTDSGYLACDGFETIGE